jgi:hypothetical protein
MLLPLMVDQLRATTRARRHAARPPRQPTVQPPRFEVPAGVRYQLFRALRAMARGQAMIVRARLPAMPFDAEGAARCRAFLKTLNDTASWRDRKDVEAVFVPGTPFPGVIGQIMIRSGWCAPSEQPHHIPNLRAFSLTERGREMLDKAWLWWAALGYRERLRLVLME